MTRRLAGCVGVSVVLTVAGCGGGAADGPGVGSSDRAGVPFELSTHCGIDELGFEGRWYERVGGVLDDGHGNPPPGWDNPFHAGTLTTSGTTAVFSDGSGHRETFTLRRGATGPKSTCA